MHGSEYKLAAVFKITALRIMMSKRRELFDQMESVVTQKHGTTDSDDKFEDLYKTLKDYGSRRRIDTGFKPSTRGDPMDIGQVGEAQETWSDQG